MKKLILASHPLCPFNQRLVVTLLLKGQRRNQDFEVRYFDLANIPDWFKAKSPRNEMPILILDDETTLFKTNPINEYLNQLSAGDLHAENLIQKAKDRYWVEYCGNILNTLRDIFTSSSLETFKKHETALFNSFGPLEHHLDHQSKYWRNQHHTLVDGAFIPAFTLMFNFDYFLEHPEWSNYPNTVYWAKELTSTVFAEESKCPNYNAEFDHFFELTNSNFKKFITKKE